MQSRCSQNGHNEALVPVLYRLLTGISPVFYNDAVAVGRRIFRFIPSKKRQKAQKKDSEPAARA